LWTFAAQHGTIYHVFTDAALTKKKVVGVQLGAPAKSAELLAQVRRLKASGASNQAIARALKMSPSTVAKCLLAKSN
jgi:DNA-binding NarL/FixJ family response regulator